MRHRGRVSGAIVALVLIALGDVALAAPPAADTTTFRVPENGIEFSAPSAFFPKPTLSDTPTPGVKYVESTKGALVLTYEARVEPPPADPAAALEAEFSRRRSLPLDGTIAYERLQKGSWFILSGTDGSSVYYTKAIVLENGISILDAIYSVKRKEMLDSVVANIMHTFVHTAPMSSARAEECAPGGKAQKILQALPELAQLAIEPEDPAQPDADSCSFAASADGLHHAPELRALVHRGSGEVRLWDAACKVYRPLEIWRQRRIAGVARCE